MARVHGKRQDRRRGAGTLYAAHAHNFRSRLAIRLDCLERVGTGDTFRLIGVPPLWWATTFKTSPESPIDVGNLAHFLQHFLDESESAWRDHHDQVVRSGPWSHRDLTSILHQFEATALTVSHQPLLLIERIDERFDQIQRLLQQARDQRLHHIDQVQTHERTQTSLTGSLAIATQERDDVLALLQHLDLAAIVTNQEGRVTFMSPRCLAWIERPSTTVIGQPWEQSLPLESADQKHLRQTWETRPPPPSLDEQDSAMDRIRNPCGPTIL